MSDINQLVNQDLDHMVRDLDYVSMVNAAIVTNEMWSREGDDKAVAVRGGERFRVYEEEPAEADQDAKPPRNIESMTVKDYLDNGNDTEFQKYGYYYMKMKKYSALTKASVDDLATSFTDTMANKTKWIGGKASKTRDLQCRRALTQAYLGGNTYSTTVSGTSVTEIALKDVNGFMTVYETGIPFEVSASHPLPVTITNAVLGTVTRNVIGCTPGVRNDADDTIPGTITLSAAVSQIALGDHVISSQAPPHSAPNGKSSPFNIEAADTLNLTMIMDFMATLNSHGAEPNSSGFNHFIGDTSHWSQLWRDSAFREAYRGQYQSSQLREGAPVVVGNTLFEFSHIPARSTNENGVLVRRAVVTSAGCLTKGYYEKDPKQTYATVGNIHNTSYDATHKVHHVIRKAIDAEADMVSMLYKAYWGFSARTDSLSKTGDYPNSPLKRGVGFFSA